MATTPRYRIHPGIGIARLGDSPSDYCISPEEPAALPIACTEGGNTFPGDGGKGERRVDELKDSKGRIKRQAARFRVYVYDDDSPEGRPLELGDSIAGGGNQGTLIDIQWRVHLANKKASWYEFDALQGEHGYAPGHQRRNADVTAAEARQQLIIDPGPRIVDATDNRRASFGRDAGDVYATTFPPPLEPCSIDTLGDLVTDDRGRLLVLGGHGCSGSAYYGDIGHPRIDEYANNDGWFDDTSDGPVTARLVMHSEEVDAQRFVDVEYPAWVIVGYPAYVPEILDVVTLTDVLEDTFARELASRTDLYGEAGTFDDPETIDPSDRDALALWKSGRLRWNPDYRPWFYRDVWPILFRPSEFTFLSSILGQSNYPHDQTPRGRFDPFRLGVPPVVDAGALETIDAESIAHNQSGELFVETFAPIAQTLEKQSRGSLQLGRLLDTVRPALAAFAGSAIRGPAERFEAYLRAWREGDRDTAAYPEAREALENEVRTAVSAACENATPELAKELRVAVSDHLRKYLSGKLLRDYRRQRVEGITVDPHREYRQFLFDALRKPGEENRFRSAGNPDGRMHGLPLMPLLCGDNPITNTLPSKFLRLTDLQFFTLRQWARGLFRNEAVEGLPHPDPWLPYAGWVNATGRDLDRGVISNVLGGAFCPGGEVGWIMRNPAIYLEPYRVKADPAFSSFRQTAAQANAMKGFVPEADYSAYVDSELDQDDDFERGMQPGDLTKHMSIPWQSDFNECSTQVIDVTYEGWNELYPNVGDDLTAREQSEWITLWWPAHRPMQTYVHDPDAQPDPFIWVDWSRGVPQTAAGDLKMVTEWRRLGFVRRNPFVDPSNLDQASYQFKYVTVERTQDEEA
ncbi:MAG TPA: LodA/GoxA family CTQ-dependent oxidase [Actinomycetota bacterium]|nr:LodA/GoxA family CTQ-dependent oxidase [Actinomycetota bacterium]